MIPTTKDAVLKFITVNPGASIEQIRLQLLLAPRDVARAIKELGPCVKTRGGRHWFHDAHPIEKWYTGKALDVIRNYVLPTLTQAEKDGFWPKGASRKVTAALNKQAVAAKFAKANDRDRNRRETNLSGLLDDVRDNREHYWESKINPGQLLHSMMFGQVVHAPGLVELSQQLEALCVNDAERVAVKTAQQWVQDCTPIGELVHLLDSRRIPPTIVLGSLSPTVAKHIGHDLNVQFDTIALPPMKSKWMEVTIKGVKTKILVYTILWPEGTRHNRSRFAFGSRAGNDQCHACGHAIKDVYNWVPLMADGPDGKISLWVGRDCARKLFAVDIKGDGQFLREKT